MTDDLNTRDAFCLLRAASAALMITAFAASPVCAQTPNPAAAAPDTKIIGDWGVRCYTAASPSPCEMQEVVTQSKTGNRVMSMSLAFVPSKNQYVFQLAVPLGVSLAKGAAIVANGFNGPAMAFRRCDRGGCYVEGFIDGKMIDALAAAGGAGKITVSSFDGHVVNLPLSLRGFADARTAMIDLARTKASATH